MGRDDTADGVLVTITAPIGDCSHRPAGVCRLIAMLSESCRRAFLGSKTRSPLLKVLVYRPSDTNPYRDWIDSSKGSGLASGDDRAGASATARISPWACRWPFRDLVHPPAPQHLQLLA
jgi:hypothetical protein